MGDGKQNKKDKKTHLNYFGHNLLYLKETIQKVPNKYRTKQATSTRHAVVSSGTKSVLQLLRLCLYVQSDTVLFGPSEETQSEFSHSPVTFIYTNHSLYNIYRNFG